MQKRLGDPALEMMLGFELSSASGDFILKFNGIEYGFIYATSKNRPDKAKQR